MHDHVLTADPARDCACAWCHAHGCHRGPIQHCVRHGRLGPCWALLQSPGMHFSCSDALDPESGHICMLAIDFLCSVQQSACYRNQTEAACWFHLQDLSPEYAGALLGLSNTAGALPGILGVTSVGFLLEKTQNWGASLFYPTAACQIFGLIIYTIFASSKRQDWATR